MSDENEDLPPRAEKLLAILKGCVGRNADCWPSLAWLAGELGVGTRALQYWIRLLVGIGRIKIEKTGRQNRYSLIGKEYANQSDTHQSDTHQSAPQTRTNQRLRHAPISASDTHQSAPIGLPPLDELLINTAASVLAPAAAVVKRAGESTMQALEKLGLPQNCRPALEADASLAEEILAHGQFRFACGRAIRNKVGYLVRCCRAPLEMGFTRGADGLWQAPEGQPPRPKAGKGFADQGAKILAERAEREAENARLVDEEGKRLRHWQAQPEALREKIRQIVREQFPAMAYKGDDSSLFRGQCSRVLEAMERQGDLMISDGKELT